MKELWQDRHKRRGLITTTLVHLLLFLLFFWVGLTYLDPKPEDGIVINFGNSATGLGQEADGAPVQQQQQAQQTPTTRSEAETPTEEPSQEPVATQEVTDAPSLDTKSQQKNEVEEERPVEPTQESQSQKSEPEPEPEPEASDALKKLLQSTKSSKAGGEGVAGGAGDQGDPDGDRNSTSRTGGGGGGSGGDGNYQLGGRLALQKPKPDYPCTDEGRVVVKIYVDRSGRVTRAVPGERTPGGTATTTTSSCLFQQAKRAAEKTTWQASNDAPDQQIGYIIYNFYKQ